MTSYLLDTHTWSWSLLSTIVPTRVVTHIREADAVHVSAISLYEIRQKVRIGKWPQMEAHAENLADILAQQDINPIAVTSEISDLAGAMEWGHRDPFDRIIAATSIKLGITVVSADAVFDELSSRKDWPGRLW